MELLDQLGKALEWLKKYDKRNQLECIGESIILSIVSYHTPSSAIVKDLLIRSAQGCEVNNEIDQAFVDYVMASSTGSPPSSVTFNIPPQVSIDTLIKLCLMKQSFN